MSRQYQVAIAFSVIFFSLIAGTASAMDFKGLTRAIADHIFEPVVALLVALSLVLFLWGMVKYISSGANAAEAKKGGSLMTWGVIGLAVMLSVWGLVNILVNTFPEARVQTLPAPQRY